MQSDHRDARPRDAELGKDRSRSRTWGIAIAIALVLLWITRWASPAPVATSRLDPSYMQCMAYALTHALQFGRDIAFTYGPMGYFASSPFEPELFWVKILAWEIVAKLTLAAFLIAAGLRLSGWFERLVWFVAVCLPPTGLDAYFFLALLSMARWSVDRAHRSPVHALPVVVLTVLVALVKFTYFVVAGAACVALVVAFTAARSWKAGLALAAAFGFVFLGVWMMLGQSPASVADYLGTSLQLAGAFSETMSRPAPGPHLAFGLVILVVTGVIGAMHVSASERRVPALAFAALCAFTLFVTFKAGFVRSMGNQITFFGFCAAAPYLLVERGARAGARSAAGARTAAGSASTLLSLRALLSDRSLARARVACTIASLAGFSFVAGYGTRAPVEMVREWAERFDENVREIADPFALREKRAKGLVDRRERFALPRVRAQVGTRSVDNFHSEHGVVFLNDFDWRPRLVDHAYSVMTPELQRANVAWMESSRAADFMLFSSGGIDGRLCNMEDAGSLFVLLRDYHPTLAEESFILFERDARAPLDTPERPIVFDRELRFGDSIDFDALEGRVHLLAMEIAPTLAGRARKIVYSLPPIFVAVETTEGTSGEFRVVPTMITTGALVTPWLVNTDAWQRWLRGDELPRIRKLTLVPPTPSGCWDDRVRVRVVRADDLAPRPTPELVRALEYSMLRTPPDAITAAFPPRRMLFRGRMEVLIMHPPSQMSFEVEPGEHVVSATFGILPEAYNEGGSDGATFKVVLERASGGAETLFEKTLDPKQDRATRPPQTLELRFETREHARLLFETGPGPNGNAADDWTFWTRIEIRRDGAD